MAEQTKRLHLVEHAEVGGHQPVDDPARVVRAIRHVGEDRLGTSPELDGVPEVRPTRQQFGRPVVDQGPRLGLRFQARPLVRARHPALEPNRQDAVEDLVCLGLDLGCLLGIEPDLRGSDLLDLFFGRELVEEVMRDDVVGGVHRCRLFAHLDSESIDSEDLRNEQHGLDHHVRPHVLPAVKRSAEVDLEPQVERVDALVDERRVAGQFMPRELVDGNHRASWTQAVQGLPGGDGLLLDGKRRDLRDAASKLPQDVAVRSGSDHSCRPPGRRRPGHGLLVPSPRMRRPPSSTISVSSPGEWYIVFSHREQEIGMNSDLVLRAPCARDAAASREARR